MFVVVMVVVMAVIIAVLMAMVDVDTAAAGRAHVI
jgi:hypothetical protein